MFIKDLILENFQKRIFRKILQKYIQIKKNKD